MIRAKIGDKEKQWDSLLDRVEFSYNTSVNRFTGITPFEIVYSKVPNHVLDLVFLPKLRGSSMKADDMVAKASQSHNEVRTKLVESKAKYKEAANKHRRFKEFKEGELVMIHLWKERFPMGTYNKTKMKKYGPFKVKDPDPD